MVVCTAISQHLRILWCRCAVLPIILTAALQLWKFQPWSVLWWRRLLTSDWKQFWLRNLRHSQCSALTPKFWSLTQQMFCFTPKFWSLTQPMFCFNPKVLIVDTTIVLLYHKVLARASTTYLDVKNDNVNNSWFGYLTCWDEICFSMDNIKTSWKPD